MQKNTVLLQFNPPINYSHIPRFTLPINKDKIATVEALKLKIARKINYYQQCMTLTYCHKTMQDKSLLKDYGFKDGDSIGIVLTKRDYQVPKQVERLIVGGIDLTDIKELNHLLKKKDFNFIKDAFPQKSSVIKQLPASSKSKMEQDGNDMQKKYKTQIETIKTMGFQDTDSIIVALIQANGNVESALELLFAS